MNRNWRQRVTAGFCGLLLLAAALVGTAGEPATSSSIPAPQAWDYVRMSPEERSALRARVNALPPEQLKAHNDALSAEVNSLPTWIYEALSNEMVSREFCGSGHYTGPLPKPPTLDAWEYVRRVPHQRYHYRLRARALPAAERAAYDAHLAAELATLPPWLQQALAEEARRYDEYLGLDPCQRLGR